MKLTTQLLAAFIGGQFEVQNTDEKYIYRGEIKTAEVVGGELSMTFSWMARGEGFPPIPTGWVNESNLTYEASLGDYAYIASDIGPGREGGDNRLCIHSTLIGELGVFYPPNGSKLDPTRVKGLELGATVK